VTLLQRNVVINLLGQGLLLGLGLLSARSVFVHLGGDGMGLIYFMATLSAVSANLLDLGVGATLVRETASRGSDPSYLVRLARTGACFCWVAYLVLALILFAGASLLIDHWVRLERIGRDEAIRHVRILGLSGLLALPRACYSSLLRGLQRMGFANGVDVAATAVQYGGVAWVLSGGGGFPRVVEWMLWTSCLWTAAYAVAVGVCFRWSAVIPRWDGEIVRENRSYALQMSGISALSLASLNTDKMLLSRVLPLGAVGTYLLAHGMVFRATMLSNAVSQAALPHLASLLQSQAGQLPTQYRKLQDLMCLLTIPLFALFPFAVGPVLGVVLNREIAAVLLVPVSLLALGCFMISSVHLPYAYSLAVGRPDIALKGNLYALVLTCTATPYLTYRWGMQGAALAWILQNLLIYAYTVPRICRECLQMGPLDWFSHLGRYAAWAAVPYGAAWLLRGRFGETGPRAALPYALATLVFVVGGFWLLGPELRGSLKKALAGGKVPLAAAPED